MDAPNDCVDPVCTGGQLSTAPDDTEDADDGNDCTTDSCKNGTKSKGRFEEVAALAEAVTLGNIALRVPYKRLRWDAQTMTFTNSPEATALVRRPEYRTGWEALIE